MAEIIFDLFDAIPNFFVIEKRSTTLDGTVPLRAAQGCTPFMQGNAAGFHLRLLKKVFLEPQDENGDLRVRVSKRTAEFLNQLYAPALERCVSLGFLRAKGFWHRTLQRGWTWQDEEGFLNIWTGKLIRPSTRNRVLITEAYNRRVRISIAEAIYASSENYVPLIIRIAISSIKHSVPLDYAELASIIPMPNSIDFKNSELSKEKDAISAFSAFYDADNVAARIENRISGKYRNLMRRQMPVMGESSSVSLVPLARNKGHALKQFSCHITEEGPISVHGSSAGVDYIEARTISRITGSYDGSYVRGPVTDVTAAASELRQMWCSYGGSSADAMLDTICKHVIPMAWPFNEPMFVMMPWFLVRTPPGWSCLVDGLHYGNLEGLRAVVATDVYPITPTNFQLTHHGGFEIAEGIPYMRIIPIPRKLIEGNYRHQLVASVSV